MESDIIIYILALFSLCLIGLSAEKLIGEMSNENLWLDFTFLTGVLMSSNEFNNSESSDEKTLLIGVSKLKNSELD